MMELAFGILAAAALFGFVLAILYARGPDAKPIGRVVPAVHATVGAAGLAVLIAALRGGPSTAATPGTASGTNHQNRSMSTNSAAAIQ